MAELSREEMEKLILGYEDLSPAERAIADDVLAQYPDLAKRLQWHQEKELSCGRTLPIAPAAWSDNHLSAAENEAQQESLRGILANWEVERSGGGGAGPTTVKVLPLGRSRRRQTLWLLPLAAILAIVALVPRGAPDGPLISDLTSNRVAVPTGTTRGADTQEAPAGSMRTGEAFALDFFLQEDAFVVIYHVDPDGQISRVFPSGTGASPVHLAGGRQHRVPGPDSAELWVLGPETGTESFLVASTLQSPEELGKFRVPAAGSSRDTALQRLREGLEASADEVKLYEFFHTE